MLCHFVATVLSVGFGEGGIKMRRINWAFSLLAALAVMAMPVAAPAQTLIIRIAPPELPVYEQPPLPEPGYIWAPGYWAYGTDGYYWVPGTWVQPPSVGLLWTPGYWGWHEGVYGWNAGYWGPHIGFYGGVNYGFGYSGVGYEGGRWNNGVFAYNRTVNNFGGVTVTNVYDQTIVNTTAVTRVSFNGGTGGTTVQPTPQEQAVAREPHTAATPAQTQQQQTASTNKTLLASVNHGNPTVAATAKPGEFTGKGVVSAKAVQPAAAQPSAVQPSAVQPNALKPAAEQSKAAPVAPANPAAEKKEPAGNAHSATTAEPVSKPPPTQAKPLAAVSPPPKAPAAANTAAPKSAPPHPVTAALPPPHPVAAPKPAPHPVAAARPAAKPAGPPPKKKE